MSLRQAAQQALEALEKATRFMSDSDYKKLNQAIDDLRAALAEPEQEPVAWRVQRSDGQYELYFLKAAAERAADCYIKRPPVEPLYTAPTPRKPLTDKEIQTIWAKTFEMGSSANTFARAIERAHGIGGGE